MNGILQDLTSYRCVSGKVSWATRSRAKKIGKIWGHREGKVLRAYRCAACGAWHLYTKCYKETIREQGY